MRQPAERGVFLTNIRGPNDLCPQPSCRLAATLEVDPRKTPSQRAARARGASGKRRGAPHPARRARARALARRGGAREGGRRTLRAEADLAGHKARAAAAEEARAALARHAHELERALREAERAGLALFEQARRAQDDAFGAKLLGVLGAVGTGVAGFAAGYGAAPARAPRRKKTKNKNGGGR